MTATTPLGKVRRDADGVRLEFTRSYHTDRKSVWAAITHNDRLELWFGRWSGDPATGSVLIATSFEDDAPTETATIDECDPPRRLAMTHAGPEGPWPLVLDLEEHDGTTSLRFVHHLAEPYDAGSIGPGWHYYLDRLGAVIAGEPVPDVWEEFYPALASAYLVPAAPETG